MPGPSLARLALAGALVLGWRSDSARGVAAGLALLVVAVLAIDDTSERRARGYASALHAEGPPTHAP